ncbi:MAG: HNH endonuclease [Phaeodactylibacter sp.]|nr:HNH endonuclease [Phaeodactylibacter sp.]MCB9275818.1 HNH endonuclease [Lewinellaceae bacterium]
METPALSKTESASNAKTYSYEEAFNATVEYFGGDELAANVWVNKYALKDSFGNIYELTPEDMHRRIAAEIARIERQYPNPLSEEDVLQLLKGFRYIVPQGSPMAGIGNPYQVVSLSNCFVIGNDADSYGGIAKSDEEQVQLMKRRGGVGQDLSHLRPSGTPVLNSALTSTGIVPFMERYSNSTREVAQGGRRGALMLTVSIKHPDAEGFIDAKMEQGKVTGANVSVRIDDDFMRAAMAGKPYTQQYPVDAKTPKVKKEADAARLWGKIIHNAWKSAEPGVLFWDTIIRESVPDCYAGLGYRTISTNPCLTGDALIAVADGRGHVPIRQLAKEGLDVPVYCLNDEGRLEIQLMRNPRVTGLQREVYIITLDDGSTIRATSNHKFRLKNGAFREVKDLNPGDSLMILTKFQGPVVNVEGRKQTDYWWLNNGAFRSNKPEHRLIAEFYQKRRIKKGEVVHHKDYDSFNNHPDNLEAMTVEAHNALHQADMFGAQNPIFKIKADPAKLRRYSLRMSEAKPGLKNGKAYPLTNKDLFEKALIEGAGVKVKKDCEHCASSFWVNYHQREISYCSFECLNQHINTSQAIRAKRADSANAAFKGKAIQKRARQLEVFTRLKYEQKQAPKLKDWEAECRKQGIPFRLGTKHGFDSFQELKTEAEYYNHRIQSVEFAGYEDVYNGTVDHHHNFFAGGWASSTKDGKEKFVYLNQKNCGEIPLSPYDSCRLLAINLYGYVEEPFTDKAWFNFDKFATHVQAAQRMMDDIIDLEIEKIGLILDKIEKDPEAPEIKATEHRLWEKIRKACTQGRRTGVGITAEGDMLAALGLRYGSNEAIEFSVKVHRALATNAYRASVVMAAERGPFPIYDSELEKDNPFIQRIKEADPALYEEMLAHGRRNIALLTIAPTGTTSLMTQTTSGIEPAFLISYKRRRKVNPSDKDAKVTFIDEVGDHWEEYNVFHHKFITWLQVNGYDVAEVTRLSAEELRPVIERSPYYRATANDVDWVQKVKMQGAIQKWVDHSISVTVNVPEDTSEEMVKKIYQSAWEAGCKGCTIYREGSRSGVLVSDTGSKTKGKVKFEETMPPKRPARLEAAVVRFKNNAEDWIAVIGLYENRPYEIFTGRAEDMFKFPDYVTRGWVLKIKDEEGHNRYDLQFLDREGFRVTIEGLSRSFNKEYWNYAKLISGVLRHGMPIPYVVDLVEGLNVAEDYISTWKNGVVRALKRFVPDGTQAADSACPSCNDPDGLIYKEGCLICKSCGYSECG